MSYTYTDASINDIQNSKKYLMNLNFQTKLEINKNFNMWMYYNIILDELDSLVPSRGISGDSGGVIDRFKKTNLLRKTKRC